MQYENFYQTLGEKIRVFRKLKNMTQKELAQRINKSLACVSKYEKGTVAIDVLSIYEIAEALSVAPQMLLPKEEQFVPNSQLADILPAIFRHRYLYIYLYIGERRSVVSSCVEIQHENAHVVLYVDLQDPSDYKSCKYLMTGEISCCETNVIIEATNPLVHGDLMLLCFSRIDLLQNKTIGICTTVTPSYRFRSLKCYLSPAPDLNSEQVKESLVLTKEELAYIKKNHSLIV